MLWLFAANKVVYILHTQLSCGLATTPLRTIWNKPLDFGADPGYNPDPGIFKFTF